MCLGRLIACLTPPSRDRHGPRRDQEEPAIAQVDPVSEQHEFHHDHIGLTSGNGRADYPPIAGRGSAIDRELYVASTLEPTLESFFEILGIAVDRHRAIRQFEEALKRCEDDLKNVQMAQDVCDIMIDFLMSKVDECPELIHPMDYYGLEREDGERDIEGMTEKKDWLEAKLQKAVPELVKAMDDMYHHAGAFFSAICEEPIDHGSLHEDFVNTLKVAITCRTLVARAEQQYREARHDFNKSNRGPGEERRSDDHLESPGTRQHSAAERQRRRRELRHRWRLAEKRRQIQRANQAEREARLLEDQAVPFLQQYGKLPLSLSGDDNLSGRHAPRSLVYHGWASEPEFRLEMRRARAEVFKSHRQLDQRRNNYLFRMGCFLFAHPNATKDEWDRRWASESATGWDIDELERQGSRMVEDTRARYDPLRRKAKDRCDLFLPFSTTQLASRSGDGATGSAPAEFRRDYPQYLVRSGVHRKVSHWLSRTVTEGSASVGANTISSVDRNDGTHVSRIPSPSIHDESLAMSNAREARLKRMSSIRDALREQGAHLSRI